MTIYYQMYLQQYGKYVKEYLTGSKATHQKQEKIYFSFFLIKLVKHFFVIFRMDSNFVKLTVRAQYKFKASNNDEVGNNNIKQNV